MPRIPDLMRDGIAFLYPTMDDAKANNRVGGSGFVVGIPAPKATKLLGGEAFVPYLISNRHVVWNVGASVARFNKRNGGMRVLAFEPTDWIEHPDGDDLAAVCIFGLVNSKDEKMTMASTYNIMPEKMAVDADIGPGDEVFMIGRFVNHQGTDTIEPSVRFGNISMKPEPIYNRDISKMQLSWAVEMRSRTGFSGSPVIVYRQPGTALGEIPETHQSGWAVLGVNWGHIIDEDGENTWLNGVVPSWKVLELLEHPKLRAAFDASEQQIEDEMKKGGAVPSAAVSAKLELAATGENPQHKEDFNSLLGAAARKRPQGDQT